MTDAPIHSDDPIPGYYKYRRQREAPWEPCAIWRMPPTEDNPDGGPMVCRIGTKQASRMENPLQLWTFVADKKVSKADFFTAYETGSWPADPPPVPEARPESPKPTGVEAGGPVERKIGPGDNSRDPTAYAQMLKEGMGRVIETGELLATSQAFAEAKGKLLADADAALAHFVANPIKVKADADRCENWRERIAKAAKALNATREEEKAPFKAIVDEIDARYFTPIRDAEAKARKLGELGSAWARAEDTRKLKEAQEAARKQLAEEQAREHAAQEQAALQLGETPPEAPEPVAVPVVVIEKTLIGTGTRRRSAKAEKATAVITDLAAAAAYYAEQGNADLIELIQKLANKAAAANARVPGCRMSWEKQPTAEAAE